MILRVELLISSSRCSCMLPHAIASVNRPRKERVLLSASPDYNTHVSHCCDRGGDANGAEQRRQRGHRESRQAAANPRSARRGNHQGRHAPRSHWENGKGGLIIKVAGHLWHFSEILDIDIALQQILDRQEPTVVIDRVPCPSPNSEGNGVSRMRRSTCRGRSADANANARADKEMQTEAWEEETTKEKRGTKRKRRHSDEFFARDFRKLYHAWRTNSICCLLSNFL